MPGNKKGVNLAITWSIPWRRERDSNPRNLAVQRFSRPPQSTTLPSLRRKNTIRFRLLQTASAFALKPCPRIAILLRRTASPQKQPPAHPARVAGSRPRLLIAASAIALSAGKSGCPSASRNAHPAVAAAPQHPAHKSSAGSRPEKGGSPHAANRCRTVTAYSTYSTSPLRYSPSGW